MLDISLFILGFYFDIKISLCHLAELKKKHLIYNWELKKNLRYIVIIFKLHIEYLFNYFTQSDLYYYFIFF